MSRQLLRYAAYCGAKFMIGWLAFPAPPGIVQYQLGAAHLVMEGLLLPGSCLVSGEAWPGAPSWWRTAADVLVSSAAVEWDGGGAQPHCPAPMLVLNPAPRRSANAAAYPTVGADHAAEAAAVDEDGSGQRSG